MGEYSLLQSALIIFGFIFASSWAVLDNKWIMKHVLLDSNVLMLCQCVGSVGLLAAGVAAGAVQREVVSFVRPAGVYCVAVAYTANVAFGLLSLRHLSVAMAQALKRLTVVACWVGEFWLDRSPSTDAVVPALCVLLAGVFIAGYNDLEFDLAGYIYGLLSCVGQGVSFVLSKTLCKPASSGHLDTVFSVVFMNSVVSGVLLIPIIYYETGFELQHILRPGSSEVAAAHLVVNIISIFALNVLVFLNCTVNSPLTHAVAGNFKAILTTVAGVVAFSTPISVLGGTGLAIAALGGGLYSSVRLQHKKRTSPEPSSPSGSFGGAGEKIVVSVCNDGGGSERSPHQQSLSPRKKFQAD